MKVYDNNNIILYNSNFLSCSDIDNNSIDLIVTSPPYNLDVKYKSIKDNIDYIDYLQFTQEWLNKCYLLLKNDGRLCLNVPLDVNKNGKQSMYADILNIAKNIGWKYNTTIIWNENNISKRTAWGSFKSASAPNVITPVETIIVLYKNNWKKTSNEKIDDITKEEFIAWTNGLWTFNGENKTKSIGHPSPFPIELPNRCIKLFSYVNEVVLDPFCGSGTTLVAAYLNKRKGIGVEIDTSYCNLIIQRLSKYINTLSLE